MPETRKVLDSVTLRFVGNEESDSDLHELRAIDVSDVLRGLAGIVGDFDKAGVFHVEGPADSQVLVRPPKEGSFVIEAIRLASENWEGVAAITGVPSLATLIQVSTKSARAGVQDFEYLENGNVKITWQDNTVHEVPKPAWDELNKRKRRRKKQLREIMAPLSDERVSELDVSGQAPSEEGTPDEAPAPEPFVLTRADYDSVAPEDEVEESAETFEVDAQMQTIDFGDPKKWRVKAAGRTRKASVEDASGSFLKLFDGWPSAGSLLWFWSRRMGVCGRSSR
ncbi:hypothetical protein O4158_23085 [Gordonia amicalis]|uniref:hypothetical protein n=1 Tax=Gordonia amicalis TaxID=89053 RepID=UPI0022B3CB4A|nr:hypothetical protein [Gordonia amicalis]MCZ4581916.1 hypothetical protein [Gordonia amicalis]